MVMVFEGICWCLKMEIKGKPKIIIINIIFVVGCVLAFNQRTILKLIGLFFIATGFIFDVIILGNSYSNEKLKGGKKNGIQEKK